MTAFLTALVIVVAAVAVLNLLLTFGMLRQLRQHTERLSTLDSQIGQPLAVMLEAGRRVGEFAATTTDGEPISRDLLSGPTLVGAFTPAAVSVGTGCRSSWLGPRSSLVGGDRCWR